MAASQGKRAGRISLPDAIIYVATKSKWAQTWARNRFKRKGTHKGAPDRPLFDEPIAPDVVGGLNSEGYGLSLHGDAIDAIKIKFGEGKLKCRGVSFVGATEWANIDISAEGELLAVLKAPRIRRRRRVSGGAVAGLPLAVAYQDADVELSELRRCFPQSSGRGGTQLAEFVCREWLRRHKAKPIRRKADVWKEAQRKFEISRHAFMRAWKASAPKEWKKRRGRPRKPAAA
jgi:hypothetical protein